MAKLFLSAHTLNFIIPESTFRRMSSNLWCTVLVESLTINDGIANLSRAPGLGITFDDSLL